MSSTSVSKISLILEIKGKSKITCDLKRHLSPKTVGILSRSLPLEGNAHLLGKSIVYFETPIDSGIERAKSIFKKGDVAFLPAEGSICFFIGDSEPGKKMTPLGKITSNIDALTEVKSGDVLSLYADNG
ncbi:MAG: cyclophilin-like fold protein [Nitrosopumilaceae archaeon]